MEINTSDEAYEVYRKLKDREERVSKQNRGLNLFNADKFKPNFFISILKKVELNLLEKEEKVVVESNLIGSTYYGWDRMSVEEFLKRLKDYLSRPVYQFQTQFNRRRENKVDFYWKAKFRTKDFEFADVKIQVGEQAQEYVDSLPFNFIEEVKKIIANKKIPTDKEIKDFEKYSYLYHRKEDLERQVKQVSNSYGYGYRESEDKTIKISIDFEEYNSKLKEVETEMKALCKKYPYLEFPRFDYVEIKEPIKYEDWLKEHESEVRESWDEFDDEQKDEWDGDFDSYAHYCYESFDEEEYNSSDDEEGDDDDDYD